MGRLVPWRNRCPPDVLNHLQSVATSGLLVVQQPGPTSFVLKDPRNQSKMKVTIGEQHTCNCRNSSGDLCLHIIFVLSRVFRLPADNPLVWQKSLLAAEVDQLIRGHFDQGKKRRGQAQQQQGDGKNPVPRRPLQDDDSCPICCDDLKEDRALVYCRYGCGNNIHAACFRQYAQFNSTSPTPLLCPLCREQWGLIGEGPSHGVVCADCHGPINGDRYKCAFCATYNLCSSCFQCPLIHPQHPFDVALGPGLPFNPATRPVAQRPVANVAIPPEAAAALGAPQGGVHPLMLRELGPEDYAELAGLDDGVAQPAGQLLTAAQAQSIKKANWTRREEIFERCDTCAICLEEFREGTEVTVLPLCEHAFHVTCAFRWLTECKAVCPIDNIPVAVAHPSTFRPPLPDAGQGGGSSRATATRPNRHGGAPAIPSRRAASNEAGIRPRNRFEEPSRAATVNANQRNPNMTVTGYCPSERDLSMLFVGGNPSSAPPSAAPLPSVIPPQRVVHRPAPLRR